ncbi:extracellular solute-binding protein [Paenibacillus marinisediminis]
MRKKMATAVLIVLALLVVTLNQPMGQLPFANADGPDPTKAFLESMRVDGKDGNRSAAETVERSNAARHTENVVEEHYSTSLSRWSTEVKSQQTAFKTVIPPSEFIVKQQDSLQSELNGEKLEQPVLMWDKDNDEVKLIVDVPEDGLYEMQIDYYTLPGKMTPVERGIKINGKFPYFEARRVVFPKKWKDQNAEFDRDEIGNDLFSYPVEEAGWQKESLKDASYLFDEPLKFHLKKGKNEISMVYVREPVVLGNVTISSPTVVPTYEDYSQINDGVDGESSLSIYEAEHPYTKSDSSIQVAASSDPSVTPNRSGLITLNTLGADTWKNGGQSVTWKINVAKTGYYEIAFKYKQNLKINMPVFRTIELDGQVPFIEMLDYPFAYSSSWKNEILSDKNGAPYRFYLTEGEHEMKLIANAAPYQQVISTVREVMSDVNDLSLQIQMATGNTLDVYRDWDITEQIPDVIDQLNGLAERLDEQYAYLEQLSGQKPDDARNLKLASEQLKQLALEPKEIPVRFAQLAQGSGSVTQKLGDLLTTLPSQPLQLDKFYVYSGQKLPSPTATYWQGLKASAAGFIQTFTTDYTKFSSDDEDAIEIWVNRPRQYVMLMQQLADQQFTPKTGIKVSFSLMPSEQKLILANAAGDSPDLAMGVNEQLPYDLALRGALTDLTKFPDFEEINERFSPGALLPLTFDEGQYALPETQNFWVLFYRQDIMDALELEVPDTWKDVLDMLPKLQRYGMNFFVPLSDASAMKSFRLTAPFIYQQGGELFTQDGMKTAIDSEEALDGFKLMTDLFTIYNLPLQVPNFYNHFREGSLPIGISDFNTYIQLTTAAPELAGWWKIAPYPGIEDENGQVVRWAPGTGQSVIMFNSSSKQEEAWEFMKWWTSEETQVIFGNSMETIYGSSYRWNTSNLNAFEQLSWPEEDIQVILEQWEWLKDIPHIPGDYMLDRELSNAWNKVVFDGDNQRKALEDAVLLANREIKKKLEEFGYIVNGQTVQTITVPTIEYNGARGDDVEHGN